MDNPIAQFVDNYTDADEIIDTNSEFDSDLDMYSDDSDQPTSWELFYGEVDEWARRALASNGFGGI